MMGETVQSNLPASWLSVPLSDLCYPNRPRHKPIDFPELPFIGMEHVEAHTMRLLGTVPASTMKSSAVHFCPDDVLYGRLRSYLNKVYKPDFEGMCSAEFIVFPSRRGMCEAFLQLLLNSSAFVSFASHLDEGDRPRVDFGQIGAYPMPLPPHPEQKRIVAKIEELFSDLDAGVAELQKAKAQLKRYRQSVLKAAFEGRLTAEWREAQKDELEPASVLLERIRDERKKKLGKKHKEPAPADTSDLPELPQGWEWARLDDATLEVKDGTHDTPKYHDSGIPFVTQKHIRPDGLDISTTRFISSEDHEKFFRRSNPGRDDILISMIGVNRGMSAIVNSDAVFSIKNVGLVKPTSQNNMKLLHFFMQSYLGQRIILRRSKGGAQPFIGLTELRAWPVSVCSVLEQQEIVSEVEHRFSIADKTDEVIDQSLSQAKRLRQSILKRAFEGRLVHQDPNDEPAEKLLERIKAEKAKMEAAKPKRSSRRKIRKEK